MQTPLDYGQSESRSRLSRGLSVAAALVLAAGLSTPVFAQNVLDRNLQQGSGGLNPRGSDLAAELRFRNAVVTGNAPGGLSFRGNVGYQAPGEFGGRVGADDTFNFRRDTVYSGMGGMGIRGTDALQYQFALTTGMAPPAGFFGTPATFGRTGAASTAGGIQLHSGETGIDSGFAAVRPRWSGGDTAADIQGLSLSALRAPSAFLTTRTFQPTVLGTMQGEDGVLMGVTASVLRGVSFGPISRGIERGDDLTTPTDSFGMRPRAAAEAPDAPAGRIDTSIPPVRQTTYEELLERMRAQEGPEIDDQDPAGITRRPGVPDGRGDGRGTSWRDRMTALRIELQEPVLAERGQIGGGRLDRRLDPRLAPAQEPQTRRIRSYEPETIDMLRRAGQVDQLAPPGFDAYSVHMESAQQHMAAGRFFDAEERFTAALSARPGDPMAAIGRVHSELGAGMFLSASINLRDLLVANPELAAVRYGPELLPSPERMQGVAERLTELIQSRPAQARENGMLLAYVGYQSRAPQLVARGLQTMEAPPAAEEPLAAADEQMMRLAALLREVWRIAEAQPEER
jgi:hypothetical protein